MKLQSLIVGLAIFAACRLANAQVYYAEYPIPLIVESPAPLYLMPLPPPRLLIDELDSFTATAILPVREPAENIPETVLCEVRTHVVQVGVNNDDGTQGWGSGIYLGDKLVLTAAHVVGGAKKARVNFPDPTDDQGPFLDSVVGVVAKTDRTWDQAVIELDALPTHNPVGSPLAGDNPKRGDRINFAGYPDGRQLRVMRGQFVAYSGAVGQSSTDWFDADAGVISGYSGGAAYNDQGELFGNLWGSDGRQTTAVCLGRTKRFLLPWNARLEAWRLALASGKAKPMNACCPYCGVCGGHRQGCPASGGGVPRYSDQDDGDAPSPPPNGGTLTPVNPTPSTDLSAELLKLHADINARLDRIKGCECEDKPPNTPAPPATIAYELTESDVSKIVGSLLVSMQGDPAFKGPPGEKGDKGDAGTNGKDGVASPAKQFSEADYAKLAIEVRKRLAGSLRVRVEPVSPKTPATK